MYLRIRRRRFGQLAIASAATTAIANLAGKAVAQSTPNIIGVGISSNNSTPQSSESVTNLTPALTVIKSSLTSSQVILNEVASTTVSNVTAPLQTAVKATATQTTQRVTGAATLSSGTVVNTAVTNAKDGDVTHLISLDSTGSKVQNSVKVTGLAANSTVESIAALPNNSNSLLSVISLNSGTPPFTLATIDPTTGAVTSGNGSSLPSLSSQRRYSNLAQAPNGTIYGTSIGREGVTNLVQVDLANKTINTLVQLSYNNQPLRSDLLSLAVSPSGQLYALANPTHQATNSLFTVDVKTGVLTLEKQYDVEQITFPHP